MTTEQLINAVREAANQGRATINATLTAPYRGVKHITLRNLNGAFNGDPNDIWVGSRSCKTALGRLYLGSKKTPSNLEGWERRIETIDLHRRRPGCNITE